MSIALSPLAEVFDAVRSAALHVELCASERELETLCDEWRAMPARTPFQSWDWNEAWWTQYAQLQRRPFVLAVRDSRGKLLGIAPWVLDHSPLGKRTIRFLGSGEVASDHLSIIAQPARELRVTEAIGDWLFAHAHLWDV